MDADVTPRTPAPPVDDDAPHLVIMGVAGSGKTTVATLLAERTARPYAEADEFHPHVNIEKMSAGIPLTDDDRWPWLEQMRDWLSVQSDAGLAAIVTCSALRHSYRDVLRGARGGVRFVHLAGTPELLAERMEQRTGHFMPPSLLPSQLETLEPLDPDEDGITLDVRSSPDTLVERILEVTGAPPQG